MILHRRPSDADPKLTYATCIGYCDAPIRYDLRPYCSDSFAPRAPRSPRPCPFPRRSHRPHHILHAAPWTTLHGPVDLRRVSGPRRSAARTTTR